MQIQIFEYFENDTQMVSKLSIDDNEFEVVLLNFFAILITYDIFRVKRQNLNAILRKKVILIVNFILIIFSNSEYFFNIKIKHVCNFTEHCSCFNTLRYFGKKM